eukprot:TRINITY_DN29062_c0_g1_i1.p1 TRINITY_DN29062_c0_g1~~TRINITY_DN29062_c0_g1_i1.p1  ORF type:complete len:447 (+),score=174.86 TRINITY_DN29062_c0_g1_i1:38-1378(+)
MRTVAALLFALVGAQAFEWEYKGSHSGKLVNTVNPTICDPSVKQYAGFYDIDNGAKHYFYWAFEARNKTARTPTVLWMTGGPGCSSEVALLFENGPCKVNGAGTGTFNNPYSWNTEATLIYIDQPAGVGFSYGTMDDKDETGVANDMYAFLQDLIKDHPEWNTEFFIFGESYGGHFAPATAHRVWKGGQDGDGIKINLAGLGVGNGLTDPEIQYQYYGELAYNWSIASTGKPAITLQQYEKMQSQIPTCIALIKQCNEGHDETCVVAQTVCNQEMMGPYESTGLNPYDIREKCQVPPLCYNMTNIDVYLNNPATQAAIGVKSQTWESCNMQVNRQFAADWMKNYQTMVPDLLKSNIRVLIYAGDADFVCNWIGNKHWTLALEWDGKNAFNAASDLDWNVQGKKAGSYRTANNFTFLQVNAAGHMVPYDQPEAAYSMLDTFINNKHW